MLRTNADRLEAISCGLAVGTIFPNVYTISAQGQSKVLSGVAGSARGALFPWA